MAAPSSPREGEGLSLQTLLVASAASAGAAIIVSIFWKQGTVMAAAITPVLVALLREAFHRPTQALATARPVRRPAVTGAGAGSARSAGERTSPPTADAHGGAAGAFAGGAAAHASPPERETEPFPTESGPAEEETRPLPGAGGPTEETRLLHGAGDAGADTRLSGVDDGVGDAETRALSDAGPTGEPGTEPVTDFTRSLERPLGAPRGPGDADAGVPPSAGAREPALNGDPTGHGRADVGGPHAEKPASLGAARVRRPSLHALRRPRVKLAIVTGLLAFLIAAVVLTIPELIAGRSLGAGSGRTTLFPGTNTSSSQGERGIEDAPIDEGQDGSSPGSDTETSPGTGGDTGGATAPPGNSTGAGDGGEGSSGLKTPKQPSQPSGGGGSTGGATQPPSSGASGSK